MMGSQIFEPVAKPASLRATYEITSQSIRIHHRPRNWLIVLVCFVIFPISGFIAPIVIEPGLTKASILVVGWGTILALLSFGSGVAIAEQLFGRQELVVDKANVSYRYAALVPLVRRRIPVGELRAVIVGSYIADSESDRKEQCLDFETLGMPLRLFGGFPEAELRWAADQISHMVNVPTTSHEETAVIDRNEIACDEPKFRAPYDCRWTINESVTSLLFYSQGRWDWRSIGRRSAVAYGWNLMLLTMILGLIDIWNGNPMFIVAMLFLVLFEVIGAILIGSFLSALAAPVRRVSWEFSAGAIECRKTWLGLGPRRTYLVTEITAALIKRFPPNEFWAQFEMRARIDGDVPDYRLSFIDKSNATLCEIKRLTEGEARWMAEHVLRFGAKQSVAAGGRAP